MAMAQVRQGNLACGEVIPNTINNVIFNCVSEAANFLSSLAPWPKAMVARSRQKNLRCFLVKFMTLFFCVWYYLLRAV